MRRGSIEGGGVGTVGMGLAMGGVSGIGSIGGQMVLTDRWVSAADVVSAGELVPLPCRRSAGVALFPFRPLLRADVWLFLELASLLQGAPESDVLPFLRAHLAVAVIVGLMIVIVEW